LRRSGALPIADEAELHLGDHAEHSQDHAAHRPAGVDGRFQHPEACSFSLQFERENENISRVPTQTIQLDHEGHRRGE
jgi:hypothetical protein